MKTFKRKINAFAMGFCIALMVFGSASVYAVDIGFLEPDANLVDDTNAGFEPDDDWDTIAGQSVKGSGLGTPNYIATTGRIGDPDDSGSKSYFKTGSSKDHQDISDWNGTGNSAPPKDEILNAGAAAYVDDKGTPDPADDDLILAFFLDRFARTGSSTAGFWFTVGGVSFNEGTKTFTGSHQVGDVLVIVDFSKGGAVGTVRVLEWVGENNGVDDSLIQPAASTGNSTLQLRFGKDSFGGGGTGLACNGPHTICAISNSGEENAWDDYQSKSAAMGFYPKGSFIEGLINVTDLIPGSSCFAGFVAETRASDEVNATLKDFVAKSFPVCGVEVTKTCDNPVVVDNRDFVTVLSEYDVTINSKGPGTIFNVMLEETSTLNDEASGVLATDDDGAEQCEVIAIDGTPITPVSLSSAYSVGNLSGSTVIRVKCDTFDNPFMNNVKVTAGSSSGLSDLTDTASAQCNPLAPNPQIGLAKSCEGVSLVPDGGDGPYTIQVDNTITVSVPSGASEALGSLEIIDSKISNLTQTADSTSVSCSDAGSGLVTCSGLLLPGESISLVGDWVPEGTSTVTDPSTVVFSNTVNASGIGSISKTTQPATPATANCGLCDEDDDGIVDVNDPDTCPVPTP